MTTQSRIETVGYQGESHSIHLLLRSGAVDLYFPCYSIVRNKYYQNKTSGFNCLLREKKTDNYQRESLEKLEAQLDSKSLEKLFCSSNNLGFLKTPR